MLYMFLLDPLAKLRLLALGGETEREALAQGESHTGNGRNFLFESLLTH
jgi:hypothetical protein